MQIGVLLFLAAALALVALPDAAAAPRVVAVEDFANAD
jgi:hypothetical protein